MYVHIQSLVLVRWKFRDNLDLSVIPRNFTRAREAKTIPAQTSEGNNQDYIQIENTKRPRTIKSTNKSHSSKKKNITKKRIDDKPSKSHRTERPNKTIPSAIEPLKGTIKIDDSSKETGTTLRKFPVLIWPKADEKSPLHALPFAK